MYKLVSINITTFNRVKKLKRAVNSVLRQDYENTEIIIVDDNSNDGTEEYLKKLSKINSRVRYYRHSTNKGNASARNTAWLNSNGFYIAFMDDDDEWIDVNKITKQVQIFESEDSNLGIVCSSVNLYSKPEKFTSKIIEPSRNLFHQILAGNRDIYSPTVMTKKIILETVGGFDEMIPRGIDSEFYRTCIVRFGFDVFYMKEITTAIHEYGNNRMTTSQDRDKIIRVNIYLLKKYFFYYLISPKSFLIRVRNILKAFLSY